MTLKGVAGLFKRKNNLQTEFARMEQHVKYYIELIFLYVHPIKPQQSPLITADVRLGKQIPPEKNNLFAHLHNLYFIRVIGQSRNIIVCYKD